MFWTLLYNQRTGENLWDYYFNYSYKIFSEPELKSLRYIFPLFLTVLWEYRHAGCNIIKKKHNFWLSREYDLLHKTTFENSHSCKKKVIFSLFDIYIKKGGLN